jgi:O-antigen/teichoic acid export membrane protein
MNLAVGKEWVVQKFKKSGPVLFDQAILSGTSFLTGIFLARFLGIETYGLFALLWMIVLFGLSFSQALITKPMLSLGPQIEPENKAEYFSSLHANQLIFSVLSFVVSVLGLSIFASFAKNELLSIDLIFKISIILTFFLNYDFYRKYFFVSEQLKWPILIDSLLASFQLSGILVLYFFDMLSLESVLSLIAFIYAFLTLICFRQIIAPNFEIKRLKSVFVKHYDFAKWLIGTALLQWLCGNFFIIAGGGILGTAAVGAIRIAQNIIGLTHVIFLAMENIVPVYAAKKFKIGGINSLYKFLKKLSIQSGTVIILILITLSAFAPLIIKFLYGDEFVSYSYILVGFCIIYLLVFIGHPLRFALRTLQLTKPIFIAYLLGAVFSLVTAYPMLINWGMYGLLAGMFITQLLAQVVYIICLFKIKKTYENNPLSTRKS